MSTGFEFYMGLLGLLYLAVPPSSQRSLPLKLDVGHLVIRKALAENLPDGLEGLCSCESLVGLLTSPNQRPPLLSSQLQCSYLD
jgi:hypothetical protein